MCLIGRTTIAEYVIQDFRIATLFSNYQIDYYCKGYKTLDEVCKEMDLDVFHIENEIRKMKDSTDSESIDYKSFSAQLLIDVIVKKHHKYVRENVPLILRVLDELSEQYGTQFPELFEINNLFKISGSELLNHIQKEEDVLFPFVKTMVTALQNNQTIQQPRFGSVDNPIAMLNNDHDTEGNLFLKIAHLTNNYKSPIPDVEIFNTTYKMLCEFQDDLHKHIHLENNILFEKARQLENCFSII